MILALDDQRHRVGHHRVLLHRHPGIARAAPLSQRGRCDCAGRREGSLLHAVVIGETPHIKVVGLVLRRGEGQGKSVSRGAERGAQACCGAMEEENFTNEEEKQEASVAARRLSAF